MVTEETNSVVSAVIEVWPWVQWVERPNSVKLLEERDGSAELNWEA